MAKLDSPRTRRLLGDLPATVEPHRRTVPAAGDFADAYTVTFPT